MTRPSGRVATVSADVAARTEAASKVYGRGSSAVTALDDVTVDFPAGAFTAVMGPSGSGKSTLMHCLAGLDRTTAGKVYLGDVDLGTLDERRLTGLRRTRIGFVFQSFNLLPTLSAAENITLPADLAGIRLDAAQVERVIDAVGLRGRTAHRPSQLSGGQQQRVAVARALVTDPDLIVADEPTGNLDSQTGADVLGLLRSAVTDFGRTVVMVTHDPGAAGYADRVVFLADGRIADVMTEPTADRVLDAMKGLAR
ncbi:ABC transporter ATP-binding protein [Dactylosporangium sp. McL0621]|uniref:ABC transporter ATP-binding protein n=1 Tax=Dactylosporangium sp. McL0621 TaxID=3415678 RepID=UPI003CF265A7